MIMNDLLADTFQVLAFGNQKKTLRIALPHDFDKRFLPVTVP